MNPDTYSYFLAYTTTSGKSRQGFHARTAKQYQNEIERFEAFIGTDFSKADRQTAQAYRDFLAMRELSETTISKSMHILSAFGSYLSEETTFQNPFYRLSAGQTYIDYEALDIPDDAELERIYASIEQESPSAAMAARIVGAVGCGIEELLELTISSVEICEEESAIALLFHNYAPFQLLRRVVLPSHMYEDVRSFLDTVPFCDRNGTSNNYIFTNRYGKRLSAWSCQQALRRAGSPYTMQRLKTFATIRMAGKDVTLSEVGAFTGRTDRWIRRYRTVNHLPKSLAEREE